MWLKTLIEIGPERFDAALADVIESSTFRPDIAEIRKAAGVNRGIVDPVIAEATAALQEVFTAMRLHGPKLRAIPGEVLYGGRTGPEPTAVIGDVPARGPETPAPAFDGRVESCIAKLGYGCRVAGLEAIGEHPALYGVTLKGEQVPAFGYRERNARAIEQRWLEAWRSA